MASVDHVMQIYQGGFALCESTVVVATRKLPRPESRLGGPEGRLTEPKGKT